MISLHHSEALDLFRKWLSEHSLLRFTMTFGFFTSIAFVRVEALSEERITFLSDTVPPCESMLRFNAPFIAFGYGDSRDATEIGSERIEGCAICCLPIWACHV